MLSLNGSELSCGVHILKFQETSWIASVYENVFFHFYECMGALSAKKYLCCMVWAYSIKTVLWSSQFLFTGFLQVTFYRFFKYWISRTSISNNWKKCLFPQDLTGVQILQMLESGRRLSRPLRCPEPIFEVMLKCWSYHGFERPTFAELVLTMSRLSQRMKNSLGIATWAQIRRCPTSRLPACWSHRQARVESSARNRNRTNRESFQKVERKKLRTCSIMFVFSLMPFKR